MSAIKKRHARQAFREVTLDEKTGILKAYDERFLFIPVKLIQSIEDRLTENFGPVTSTSIQYEIGKEGGAQYIRLAQKRGLKIKAPRDVQRIAETLGTLSGWGKLDVVSFDFAKKLARIRWKNGVSVRNRNGKTPVCHFGRGILTGAVEAILGGTCESIEVACQGKGDKYCEALIGDSSEIDRFVDTQRV